MKLTIPRAALLAALAKAARIVEKSATIPILAHVLLTASEAGLDVTATDLDLSVQIAAIAKVERPGAITTSAHTLHDIVRRLPESADVAIELDETSAQLLVKSGRSRFRVATLPAADYPALVGVAASSVIEVDACELVRMIARTERAIAKDESRFYLQGIYLHGVAGDDGRLTILRAVATNGHMLAQAQTPLASPLEDTPGVIVPAKAAQEIKRLAEAHKGPLRLSISLTKIEIAAGDTVLISKLIEGTYPDYARVIPHDCDKFVNADVAPLRQAIERVAIVGQAADEKGRMGSRIVFTFADGKLELSSSDPETGGSAEDGLSVEYDGAAFSIAFAHKYLLAMMSALDGDVVRMEFTSAGAPGLFRAVAGAPELFLLMPQRI